MPLRLPRFAHNVRLQKASLNDPPLKQGEKGEAVAVVQQALLDLGLSMPVTSGFGRRRPDGIFGPETARVVSDFQTISGLKRDGIVGRETLARMEDMIETHSTVQRVQFAAQGTRPFGRRNLAGV
jgi:murein L,D-transpeptidase YcbB/YkuD